MSQFHEVKHTHEHQAHMRTKSGGVFASGVEIVLAILVLAVLSPLLAVVFGFSWRVFIWATGGTW